MRGNIDFIFGKPARTGIRVTGRDPRGELGGCFDFAIRARIDAGAIAFKE